MPHSIASTPGKGSRLSRKKAFRSGFVAPAAASVLEPRQVKLAQVAQVGFIAHAARSVCAFVSTARDAEGRRGCTPMCGLSRHSGDSTHLTPDRVLRDV